MEERKEEEDGFAIENFCVWGGRSAAQCGQTPMGERESNLSGCPEKTLGSEARLPDGKILSLPFLGLLQGGGAIQGKEGIKFCSVA